MNARDSFFRPRVADRPTIVCLCGCTRFYEEFQEANVRETAAGNIVLTVALYSRVAHGPIVDILTPEQKVALEPSTSAR